MAGFGRIVLVGATLVAGFGVAAVRAQQALDDPKNAPRIFANTCSGCHKSPAGLAKSGGTAGFLRQHYTTGPEMSNAMAAYLASAGNGPVPVAKKNEKQKEPGGPATAAKTTPSQKVSATHPLTDGISDPPRATREKEKQKNAKSPGNEKQAPGSRVAARPPEPVSPPVPPPAPEQTAQPAPEQPAPSSTAALNSSPAPASAPEQTATPGAVPDLPAPPMPSEPPADLTQPPVFSSAPLP